MNAQLTCEIVFLHHGTTTFKVQLTPNIEIHICCFVFILLGVGLKVTTNHQRVHRLSNLQTNNINCYQYSSAIIICVVNMANMLIWYFTYYYKNNVYNIIIKTVTAEISNVRKLETIN